MSQKIPARKKEQFKANVYEVHIVEFHSFLNYFFRYRRFRLLA